MKIYKLKQLYPNSPELGTVVNPTNSLYYTYKPDLYPHLWDCYESDKTIMSKDEILLTLGDTYYYINNFKIYSSILSESNMLDLYHSKYKLEENALKDIYKYIYIQIENEIISGENILLYGVCVNIHWQIDEISSLTLFKRKSPSDKWKWFRNKKDRDEYKKLNQPIYSINDLKNIK